MTLAEMHKNEILALNSMTPKQFKKWRKSLKLKQKEAADLLGLKKRIIQYYEKGERDGKSIAIPVSVSLACYALSEGIISFDGEKATKVMNLPRKSSHKNQE